MYYVYSHEALPNPEMVGKPGYTPDSSYIKVGGVSLPALPKQKWLELDPEDPRYRTYYRWNWTQRKANVDEQPVPLKRFLPVVQSQFAVRGVVMLDHAPTENEKKSLERVCADENIKFRRKAVDFFEQQREIAKGNNGTYAPTPYIDECYDILGIKKPYSFEALQSQRDPGAEAAKNIAAAITDALKQDREEREVAAVAVAKAVTEPQPVEPPKPLIAPKR